jgi:hypothetical protein
VLAACSSGSTSDGSATSSSAPSPSAPASTAPSSSGADGGDLVIEVDRGDGGAPERYTLSCAGPVSGDLPDAAAACEHLRGLDDPFAALPAGTVCSQLFGGPQTAQVTGTWAGRPVDLSLARRNGCEIAQWDSLGPLLPGPVG